MDYEKGFGGGVTSSCLESPCKGSRVEENLGHLQVNINPC